MSRQNSGGLWDTVQRARLTRVLLVYLGASFAVLQAVDIFTNQFGLPDWFFPGAAVLLLVGLPLVVATALVQARVVAAGAGEPFESPAVAGAGASDASEGGPAVQAASSDAHHRHAWGWLTWRNFLIGSVGALALWGLVVSTYMAMRSLGIGPVGSLVAAGVLDERERVIVSEFVNNTNDPHLGSVASEAFRIDLAQSPIVTVVDPASVARVLARMQRTGVETVDVELAREVAVREGIKAIIAGEVSSVGSGYVLSARLLAAETGETLAASREAADDPDEIIAAIDKLSKKLRERIGESLRTIRSNEPLDNVTTSSLDALKKYSQALRVLQQGDQQRAIILLEEAVALDSTFAMAWRKLGVTALTDAVRFEALQRAYRHRDRLTERERYLTLGTYYMGVTEETDKAISAYETLLDTYPEDSWALNNLAVQYMDRRNYAKAEQLYARAIAIDSFSAVSYTNLVNAQVALGEFDDAQRTVERFREKLPNHPNPDDLESRLASSRGAYDAAVVQMLEFYETHKGDTFIGALAASRLMELAILQGKLADAERLMTELQAVAVQANQPSWYLQGAVLRGMIDGMLRGDVAAGLDKIDAALRRYPLEKIEPLDRPYVSLAQFYSFAGETDRALQLLASQDSILSDFQRRAIEDEVVGVVALIDLFEGRPQQAIAKARLADEGSCAICVLPLLGTAYDEASEPDSAIAIYERYITTPWLRRDYEDGLFLAYMYERLGSLYELRGDGQKAIYYYGRLAELWKDADPELQPRVEAAKRAMRALSTDV